MRLGSTTLPLAGWLADPAQPSLSRETRLAAIRSLHSGHGLSAVELTLDLAFLFPQVFDAGFYSTVGDLQRELDLTCTVHLPFLWVDLSSLNEPVRESSMGCIRQAVQLVAPIRVEAYVVHLWGAATSLVVRELAHAAERAVVLGALKAQAARSLQETCTFVDAGQVCVENLEDSLFEEMLPVIEDSGASVCLDVGHLAYSKMDPVAFFGQHRGRIREVHLHDAIRSAAGRVPTVRDHLPLGQGQLDYAALLAALSDCGFTGPLIVENNSAADLQQSLARLRALGVPGFRPPS